LLLGRFAGFGLRRGLQSCGPNLERRKGNVQLFDAGEDSGTLCPALVLVSVWSVLALVTVGAGRGA
jgi:hypothetical protein